MENDATFLGLNEAAPAFNARTTHGDRTLAEDNGVRYLKIPLNAV